MAKRNPELTQPNYNISGGIMIDNNFWLPEEDCRYSNTFFVPDPNDRLTRKEELLDFSTIVKQKMGEHAVAFYVTGPQQPEEADGSALLVHMGWGGNAEVDVARLENTHIARSNPRSKIIVVNNPATGESSPLPGDISKKVRRSGSFLSQGEHYAKALENSGILKDLDSVGLYGHSYGGRTAIALAAYLDDVDRLIVTDPPGSRSLGRVGLAKAFLDLESTHAKEYIKQSEYDLAKGLQVKNNAALLKNTASLGFTGFKQQIIDQASAMANMGLEKDLAAAIDRISPSGLVVINSPGLSELNNPVDVYEIVSRIYSESITGEARPIVVQKVLDGLTHSSVIGDPRLIGHFSSYRIFSDDHDLSKE